MHINWQATPIAYPPRYYSMGYDVTGCTFTSGCLEEWKSECRSWWNLIVKQKVMLFLCIIQFIRYKRVSRFFMNWFYYKIIAVCNTWHSFAVSGVIKHLGALKYIFLLVKLTFFTLQLLDYVTRRIEKWKFGNSGETAENIFFVHECQTLPLQL
jgi:hypothetical protein